MVALVLAVLTAVVSDVEMGLAAVASVVGGVLVHAIKYANRPRIVLRVGYRTRGCSSAGRAPGLQPGGQGFKSPQLHLYLCRSVTVFVLAVFGSDCFHRALLVVTAVGRSCRTGA